MRLSELKPGEAAVIVKTHGHGAFRKRIMEMGFVAGHTVHVLLDAPLRDPVKYSIMDYEVSLRRSEAELVEVEPIAEATAATDDTDERRDAHTSEVRRAAMAKADNSQHTIDIALIGNPNCGKTSLFNVASGAREHVGNYGGVTVDAKDGHFKYKNYRFNIVDLPGTYSLSCYSPEELYVRKYLSESSPDVIINVVDSSNLERNLFLTTELIDMDCRMVIALNMYDELKASGAQLDYKSLGAMIGVPMCPLVARTGEGLQELFDTVIAVYENNDSTVRHVHINLGSDLEAAIRRIVDMLKATPTLEKHFSPRYLAIKLLEGDHSVEDEVEHLQNGKPKHKEHKKANWLRRTINRILHKPCCDCCSDSTATPEQFDWHEQVRVGADSPIVLMRNKLRANIEKIRNEDISSIVAAEKYGFIAGALAETYTAGPTKTRRTTRLLDNIATNRIFGFPIFLLIMFFIFWVTFFVGQYPMDWIDDGVAWLGGCVDKFMPDGPLKDLVADGIIGGVGGVIVFLPNILILYLCISFMEDSGYMARAAFIMDKVMHRVGLHGKSFIPLVMGFGCNVPAIMSSRSIESRSSRLITILINPFMSCSARLPIYVLLIGTFFKAQAAFLFMGLYMLGIAVAVITARLLRRYRFPKDETPFVMELPPYRMPTLKASMTHTWSKGREYLKKMGGIILFASIIVWALNYFPRPTEEQPQRDSYLEMAGKAVNPVMEPLGFHWRGTVAILAGVPAKEIVVSTLGVLYNDDDDTDDTRLRERLTAPSIENGQPDFTPATALAFMVFILLYCPCIATVTAIVRETHSWHYGLFSVLYNTAVAWLFAFIVYRVAMLL